MSARARTRCWLHWWRKNSTFPGKTSRSIPGPRAPPTRWQGFSRRLPDCLDRRWLPSPQCARFERCPWEVHEPAGYRRLINRLQMPTRKCVWPGQWHGRLLLLAAAKQMGTARADLKTRNGAVIAPDGRALSYASLAATASKIEPPETVTLKPRVTVALSRETDAAYRYGGEVHRRGHFRHRSKNAQHGLCHDPDQSATRRRDEGV